MIIDFFHKPSLRLRYSLIMMLLTSILLTLILNISHFNGYNTVYNKMQSYSANEVKAVGLSPARPTPLYGFNGEISKSPNWSNAAFLDTVASLHFKAIRYPGGSVANQWDWKTGQAIAQRFLNTIPNKKVLNNNFTAGHDLKDLKQLVNKTGCDVIFLLNMITKDLNDQISMLKNAQALGIPVKWVELGNEFYLKENAGKQKFAMPADYGKTAEQWIDAIKTQFPTAKVAVIGSNQSNWNKDVLINAPSADAIVDHVYPFPANVLDESGINFSELYGDLQKKLNNFNLPKKMTPIWVTEYNIHWAFIPNKTPEEKNKIHNYAFTWSQALATILMTSEITSFSDNIKVVINHSLANWSNFAAVDNKGTFRKLPNGIGMQAWLDASENKNTIQKISFIDDNKEAVPDYNLFGWKFTGDNTNSILLVNLLPSSVPLDLSSITSVSYKYTTLSSEKNKQIHSPDDFSKTSGTIKANNLSLPPYSITTLTE